MLYFIVNEIARTGKNAVIWHDLKTKLDEKNIEYKAYKTEYPGHATKLAKRICNLDDEHIGLIVVGGDGTMNEVINGIEHFDKIRFGMIPVGSGNDFGRGLRLKNTPEENLEDILKNYSDDSHADRLIDLGKVIYDFGQKERLFGISSGIGLDAIVCEKAQTSVIKRVLNKLHLGKLTYVVLTVWTLFSMETAEMEVTYHYGVQENKSQQMDENCSLRKVIFLAAMNLPAEGGGVPMAPNASPTDGKLSVCFAAGIPKWVTFLCLPFLVLAKHERIKGFDVRDCKFIHIKISNPMCLHTDGETLGYVDDVTFLSEYQKLRLINE